MHNILATAIVAAIVFGLAILSMTVGLLLRGRVMRGGCGSASGDAVVGCDACSKKTLNLCDEEDASNLAGPSFAATMGRFSQKS